MERAGGGGVMVGPLKNWTLNDILEACLRSFSFDSFYVWFLAKFHTNGGVQKFLIYAKRTWGCISDLCLIIAQTT